MDPQLIVTLVCITLAAAYLVRRVLRSWSGKGCGGCCHCPATATAKSPRPR